MLIVILTSERNNNYLQATVDDINLQNWSGKKLIWSDGPCPEVNNISGYKLIETIKKGPPNTETFCDLLTYCADEDILFLEDDIRLSKNCLSYIENMGCPAYLSYISYFDGLFKKTILIPKVQVIPSDTLISAQARYIPKSTVNYLIKYKQENILDGYDMSESATFMAKALEGSSMGIHIPSLVQHVGVESIFNVNNCLMDYRVSDTWMGLDYDIENCWSKVKREDIFNHKSIPWPCYNY